MIDITSLTFTVIRLLFYLCMIGVVMYFCRELKNRLPKHKESLDLISMFLIAIVVVLLAAFVGPLTFQGALNYTISESNVITSSDATNYTLTAFLAIAITYYFKDRF
jgi:hypothetical protein